MRSQIFIQGHSLSPGFHLAVIILTSMTSLASTPFAINALDLLVSVRLPNQDILSLEIIIWVSGSMLDHELPEWHPRRPLLFCRVIELTIDSSGAD